MMSALTIALYIFVPSFSLWARRRWKWVRMLGPVTLCYAGGIIWANIAPKPIESIIAESTAGIAVALGLPLMLFSCHPQRFYRQASKTLLITFLYFGLVALTAYVAGRFLFMDLEHRASVAGMLVGTYVGSMPNLVAVAAARGVPPATIVLVQSADVVVAGTYFLFLISILPRILLVWLPFKGPVDRDVEELKSASKIEWQRSYLFKALAWAILACGIALASTFLVEKENKQLLGIIVLSLVSLALALVPRIQKIPYTFETGEFLFLFFCVAVGSLTDISKVVTAGPTFLLFSLFVLTGSLSAFFLVCRFLKVDRDTALMVSAAAIFSPAMIGPVVAALGNRAVLLTGMISGLLGLAVATFLGIGVSQILGLS